MLEAFGHASVIYLARNVRQFVFDVLQERTPMTRDSWHEDFWNFKFLRVYVFCLNDFGSLMAHVLLINQQSKSGARVDALILDFVFFVSVHALLDKTF